jgi:hypothetical protein
MRRQEAGRPCRAVTGRRIHNAQVTGGAPTKDHNSSNKFHSSLVIVLDVSKGQKGFLGSAGQSLTDARIDWTSTLRSKYWHDRRPRRADQGAPTTEWHTESTPFCRANWSYPGLNIRALQLLDPIVGFAQGSSGANLGRNFLDLRTCGISNQRIKCAHRPTWSDCNGFWSCWAARWPKRNPP